MSESEIWVSDAMSDPKLIKGYWCDLLDTDNERTMQALHVHRDMKPIDPASFPKEVYAKHAVDNVGERQHIFMAAGFWCISEPCAEVLRKFDLGGTELCEVRVLLNDRQTQVGNRHFFLNFDSWKDALLPEASKRPELIDKFGQDVPDRWRMQLSPRDDDYAVHVRALNGADLWANPDFRYAFFVSERLAAALREAGMAKQFSLYRCEVVRPH